jgi:hypothetical protein
MTGAFDRPNSHRQTKNVFSGACQDRRGNESTMGKEKGKDNCCQNCKEEGRNYCCGKEKALTAAEGAVGGKEKKGREKVNPRRRSVHFQIPALVDSGFCRSGRRSVTEKAMLFSFGNVPQLSFSTMRSALSSKQTD